MPGIETGSNLLQLGKTYYDGRTIDTSNYGNSVDYEGQPATYRNIVTPSTGQTLVLPLNGGAIMARVVRNVSGINLLPGRIAIYAAGFDRKRVDGYTSTTAQRGAGIVDPWLPSTGVPNGDLFLLIEDGTVPVRRALSNSAADDAEGDLLYAITAATSQATTAGRFTRWVGTFTAAETTDGSSVSIIRNSIGLAMSACTTAGTNSLKNVRVKFF